MTHCDFRDPETLRRCGALAAGSIGMLQLCVACVAKLTHRAPDDPALRDIVPIQLYDGDTPLSLTYWVPYS